jgi:3'-phosphoadenosine 5'-phosphosulfate sulfotransferase (PAPS reductase)/FAD synthetase
VHHIVALSGGKDSTALALRLAEVEPQDYIYVCTPTGDELPEMQAHWRRCEELIGRPLLQVTCGLSLVELTKDQKMLPNWRARFCTRMLKLAPFQHYVAGHRPATVYVGLRADEDGRSGYEDTMSQTTRRYPLREWGWGKGDVLAYLESRGVEIPRRTDCARCFYQTLGEWWRLWKERPDIYASAVDDEQRTGHTYRSPQRDTWPAALIDLQKEFESGRRPKERKRGEGCRVCSM